MSKKYNGFTLVELLAVIVVLGIIAIIIVPRIINTVENSKQDSAIVSARGFMDSVTKYYVEKNTADYENLGNKENGVEITGIYTISNGSLVDSSNNSISIPFTGAPPKSGSVYIRSGEIIYGCLTIGKYSVIINESNILRSVEGTCDKEFDDLPSVVRPDGYKYLNEPIVVYYNPTTNELCDSGLSSSKGGTIDGCMKWYAYSFNGNVFNLLLDHNINPSGDENGVHIYSITSEDYENGTALAAQLGVTNIGNGSYGTGSEAGNNDKGPLTALKYLKDKTSNWQSSVSGSYSSYSSSLGYSVNYSGYKARMVTAAEVAYTKGDSLRVGIELDQWLGDNLSQTHHYEGTEAFYTITPYDDDSFYDVHDVDLGTNYLSYVNISLPTYTGVRPVVSLDSARVKTFMK